MNIHKNARLTPHGRERMVRMMLRGQTPEAAARAAHRQLPSAQNTSRTLGHRDHTNSSSTGGHTQTAWDKPHHRI